jgi:ankyrin repeat protein
VARWAPFVVLVLAAGCGGSDAPSAGALYADAERGDAAGVRELLERRGADPNERGPGRRTAVTAAAYAGAAAVVRLLVDAGADVDAQDETRANALLSTGETGDVAVLREVLRARPDLTRTNRFGGTALIPAADRGHVDMVRALLQTEIDLDHVNDLGWTALLEAVILGDGGERHREIVRLLLDAGADPNIADGDGVTPLTRAHERGYAAIADLIEASGGR